LEKEVRTDGSVFSLSFERALARRKRRSGEDSVAEQGEREEGERGEEVCRRRSWRLPCPPRARVEGLEGKTRRCIT